ncbi:hypothetical protein JEQ12_013294 [Ovis aries]|uniref:Uncharacterized protein n=1 Tax=Ovis aries TaxID=9940 RepID=A0A835ZMG2_SHEEP|nr:hypothetical protein JEQ12_013294 [Ovis aries]
MGLDAPQLWDLPRPRIESDRVRSNVSPALLYKHSTFIHTKDGKFSSIQLQGELCPSQQQNAHVQHFAIAIATVIPMGGSHPGKWQRGSGDGDTWQLTKRRPRGKSRTNGADCRFSSLSRVGLNSQGVGETCSSSGDPVELLRRDDRHADEEPVVQRFREHLHGLLNSQQQASIQSG